MPPCWACCRWCVWPCRLLAHSAEARRGACFVGCASAAPGMAHAQGMLDKGAGCHIACNAQGESRVPAGMCSSIVARGAATARTASQRSALAAFRPPVRWASPMVLQCCHSTLLRQGQIPAVLAGEGPLPAGAILLQPKVPTRLRPTLALPLAGTPSTLRPTCRPSCPCASTPPCWPWTPRWCTASGGRCGWGWGCGGGTQLFKVCRVRGSTSWPSAS